MAQIKKRKKFFDVEIPLIGRETQLLAYTLEELNGRYIKYDLTRILRGKGADISFQIKVENNQASAKPKSLILLPYFIKRIIRKGTNYVEDSFSANCKDAVVRIKPFLLTRKKVSRAVRKALRNKAREELMEYSKEKTVNEIFEDVLNNYIQKNLSLKLKKIYPLAFCDIRILKVEKEL